MGALTNAGALARDATFQDAALAAAVHRARTVIGTANAPALNVALAKAVVRNPEGYRLNLAWVVATDTQVAQAGPAYTEQQVMNAVEQVWPYLAGLYSET